MDTLRSEERMIGEKKELRIDEDLREILEGRKAVIKVVGVGGAGNNTVSRMMQIGIVGAEVIAVNTDAQDFRDLCGIFFCPGFFCLQR